MYVRWRTWMSVLDLYVRCDRTCTSVLDLYVRFDWTCTSVLDMYVRFDRTCTSGVDLVRSFGGRQAEAEGMELVADAAQVAVAQAQPAA